MHWNEFNPPPLSRHMTVSLLIIHTRGLDKITETLWKLPERPFGPAVWGLCQKKHAVLWANHVLEAATFPLHDQFSSVCHVSSWVLRVDPVPQDCCSVRTGGQRNFSTDSVDTTYGTCVVTKRKMCKRSDEEVSKLTSSSFSKSK